MAKVNSMTEAEKDFNTYCQETSTVKNYDNFSKWLDEEV